MVGTSPITLGVTVHFHTMDTQCPWVAEWSCTLYRRYSKGIAYISQGFQTHWRMPAHPVIHIISRTSESGCCIWRYKRKILGLFPTYYFRPQMLTSPRNFVLLLCWNWWTWKGWLSIDQHVRHHWLWCINVIHQGEQKKKTVRNTLYINKVQVTVFATILERCGPFWYKCYSGKTHNKNQFALIYTVEYPQMQTFRKAPGRSCEKTLLILIAILDMGLWIRPLNHRRTELSE